VAAISQATPGLAREGLLDYYVHTGCTQEHLALTGYRGAQLIQEGAVVVNDRRLTTTAPGPADN